MKKTLAWAVLFALTCPSEAFARAGGGHSHGGGILGLILLPFILIYMWYVNRRINEKKKRTEQAMAQMAAKDSAWNEKMLEAFVREDFYRVEHAWCSKNYPVLRGRLDAHLFADWQQQLEAMTAKGHTNIMENLALIQIRFVEAMDFRDKNRDILTVCLDATAMDYTVNDAGSVVDSNAGSRRARLARQKQQSSFREFWTYHRHGEDWLLSAIDQSGQWRKSVDAPIVVDDSPAESVRKCPYCGKEYRDGTIVCPQDGATLLKGWAKI